MYKYIYIYIYIFKSINEKLPYERIWLSLEGDGRWAKVFALGSSLGPCLPSEARHTRSEVTRFVAANCK